MDYLSYNNFARRIRCGGRENHTYLLVKCILNFTIY